MGRRSFAHHGKRRHRPYRDTVVLRTGFRSQRGLSFFLPNPEG
jgi:hypothetical protein